MKSPQCPKCKSASVACLGKRHALYPAGCLAIVGLLLAMVHQGTLPVDFKCESCGKRFGVRDTGAKLCLLAVALIVLLLMYKVVSTILKAQ